MWNVDRFAEKISYLNNIQLYTIKTKDFLRRQKWFSRCLFTKKILFENSTFLDTNVKIYK